MIYYKHNKSKKGKIMFSFTFTLYLISRLDGVRTFGVILLVISAMILFIVSKELIKFNKKGSIIFWSIVGVIFSVLILILVPSTQEMISLIAQ